MADAGESSNATGTSKKLKRRPQAVVTHVPPEQDAKSMAMLKKLEENKGRTGIAAVTHAVGIDYMAHTIGTTLSHMDESIRQKADKVLISNLRMMMSKIGEKILAGAHDPAMPMFVHRGIDSAFVHAWPEIEKGVMDGLILDMGFQYHKFRRDKNKDSEDDQKTPSNPFRWAKAMLLYSMQPYDLSYFAMLRKPLCFCIQMAFMIPYRGSDSILVIIYWFCTYKYDAYQCCNLLCAAKKLAFITTGIISGLLGFVKLFLCTVQVGAYPGWEESPSRCENKAPGTYPTFIFEFSLFAFRTVLVWTTFGFLYWHVPLKAWELKRKSYEQRLDSAGALLDPPKENHGQLGDMQMGLTVVVAWLGLLLGFIFFAFDPYAHADHNILKDGLDLLGQEDGLSLQRSEMEDALKRFQEVSAVNGMDMLLIVLTTLLVMSFVPYRAYSYRPTFFAGFFCLGAFARFAPATQEALLAYQENTVEAETNQLYENLVLHVVGFVQTFFAWTALLKLGCIQRTCRLQDDEDFAKVEALLHEFDADGDGTVTKGEFKAAFQKLVPGGNFAATWEKIDVESDGKLTLDELCIGLGYPHLIPDDDGKGLSDHVAKDMDLEETTHQAYSAGAHGKDEYGGVMLHFFWWDFGATSLLCYLIYLEMESLNIKRGMWQFGFTLYFLKVAIALLSFPFLIFAIPTVKDWLIRERITAYNKMGECVPKLSGAEISKRYNDKRMKDLLARGQGEDEKGAENAWDQFMGDYAESDDDDDAPKLDTSGKPIPRKPLTEAEMIKKKSKKAAKLKQQNQMKKYLPEATLFDVRRDTKDGDHKFSGADAYALL